MRSPPSPSIVDARGHRCPAPTLRLRRALERARHGAIVQLLADDPLARIDVPHFLAETGDRLVEVEAQDGLLVFTIEKTSGAGRPRGR